MALDAETAAILRGMITIGVVSNIKDDGETQKATIEWADGMVREDVEIAQGFGSASVPDEDGAIGLAFAVGGDQGHVMVLPIGNPSQRLGGLAPGEAALYSRQGGSRVHMKNDGSIAVAAAANISIKSDTEIRMEAPEIKAIGNVRLGTENAARPVSGIGHLDTDSDALVEGAAEVFIK